MSRLYETLRKIERERQSGTVTPEKDKPIELINNVMGGTVKTTNGPRLTIKAHKASRLVALTDPKSLGAEKFRALAARLESLREKRELRSLQITSTVINEGKSLIAANLAVTLVKHFGYNVLLIEGDLHRPTLTTSLGLAHLKGINQWWNSGGQDEQIVSYIYQLDEMPLSFLGAGSASDQPSSILQSSRFAETFVRLVGGFDWVIVDSTPMSPAVDANLWSRLVDGTLLVVREGVTPIKALKTGVRGLDNPKWLGVILNEASEFDRVNYADQYYAVKSQSEVNKKRS
ncbi:MAG: CpsD/CapB family tyrosine-protein kinase [Candidatus Acidiferrales bacterium]